MLPIHDKLGGFEACTFPRLPMIILSGRPEEIHAIALLTADELLGIHIARVHDMHAWQQITLGERFMDMGNRRIIRHRRGCGFDMGNQVQTVIIAGLGQMHGCHPVLAT